jgi:hypothetical protein
MSMSDYRSEAKLTRRHSIKLGAACFTLGAGPAWNLVSAAPPESMTAFVVLDDCDPNFNKGFVHDDGLRLLAADGKEVRRIGGLKIARASQ